MRRLLQLFAVCSGIAAAPLAAQDGPASDTLPAEPGSELRVWLLTAGPGEAVWERFGHNALRVLDTRTGRDVAYNWGIFDFNQVDFIPRFLKGQMLYMMAPFQTGPMVDAYAGTGRRIVMQELALTPAQRLALRDYAEWNALPENRDYTYNYFLDNCSTRVRDLLDRILGGPLADRFAQAPTGTSFRHHIRRLTRTDPLLYTGMDVLLGTPGDRPISVWEEMFLPMTLRDALNEVEVDDGNGGTRPLVVDEAILVAGAGTPPEQAPNWFAAYLGLGLALAGVLAWSGRAGVRGARWGRVTAAALAATWSLAAGLVGLILILVLFTDHTFMYWNANIFLLTPLSLPLVALAPIGLSRRGGSRAAARISLAVVVLAVLGLVAEITPAFRQGNGIFLALVLPVHVALWWTLRAAPREGTGPA